MSADPVFFTSSILPVRERLVLKNGRRDKMPLRVRIGYFYHAKLGHTLIDTGYGARVIAPTQSDLLLRIYVALLKPNIVSENPIESGLQRMDISCSDINTVIITHFHADHIGGLDHFPNAKMICSQAAWSAVSSNSKLTNALEGVFAGLLPDDMESRLQFNESSRHPTVETQLGAAHDISGDGSVLTIDLPGHLSGHFGLYFPKLNFLYATDAQWLLQAVAENRMPGFPASRLYHDPSAAMQTNERIAAFMNDGGSVMLCHDPHIHMRDIDGDI